MGWHWCCSCICWFLRSLNEGAMFTDGRPRKAERLAGFLESDRIRTLDLPQDRCLPTIANSIESAMKTGTSAAVRRACSEFLATISKFYKVPRCGIRVLAARPLRVRRTLVERTFRRLQSRNHADPCLDADGGAEGNHVLRDIPEHAMPRILPPPRLSEVRVPRFMAHSRLL